MTDFADRGRKYSGKIQIDRDGGVKQRGPVLLPQWKAPLKRAEAKQDMQPPGKKEAKQ